MDSEVWLHKYELKLRWKVKDDQLVDYIMNKGLKVYDDDKHGPFCPTYYERPAIIAYSYWLFKDRGYIPESGGRVVRHSAEFVKEGMAYFKLVDVLDFELEHGIVPSQEESACPLTPQDMGSKGGHKSTKASDVIEEAIKKYLLSDMKRLSLSNLAIADSFSKKYRNEDTALHVSVDGLEWMVFREGEKIKAVAGERYDGVKTKKPVHSLAYSTFHKKYISDAKESIVAENSLNPS